MAGSPLLTAVAGIVVIIAVLLIFKAQLTPSLSILRIGPKPGIFGNTSAGYFDAHAKELVEQGYAKYKNSVYSLWTTDMDRVIVSNKFMSDFNSLPRSEIQLTASIRHAGEYTGMDIAEQSGSLFSNVCAGQLSQNLDRLAQPVFEELLRTVSIKFEATKSPSEVEQARTLPLFPFMVELTTSATSRGFVGPKLCRDPEWLATATGYTMDVFGVMQAIKKYYRFLHPLVARFLLSVKQCKSRFSIARRLLLPLIAERGPGKGDEYPDMVQWLVESSAKQPGKDIDTLVRQMLFLNMAAIHTSAETAVNVVLELCARPEWIEMLREEMNDAMNGEEGMIGMTTLNKLWKLDSFIKECHRVYPQGLMTFNRHLNIPVSLSNGVTLPRGTYVSMTHEPINNDAEYYPSPQTFDGLRFYRLRSSSGRGHQEKESRGPQLHKDPDQHQFASLSTKVPNWGVGKFACPGRHWASAQIKLIIMVLLLEYDISYPAGQKERPAAKWMGEKNVGGRAQKVVIQKRKI